VLSVWLLGCGALPEELVADDDASADAPETREGDDSTAQSETEIGAETGTADAPDDGPRDAGMVDAGRLDAGRSEAGVDAGRLDAGRADAGRTDAGRADAGIDAGRADVGRSDTGIDAAAVDGGCPAEMVRVGGACVDRWEGSLVEMGMDGGLGDWSPYENPGGRRVIAVSRPDVVPQGYITGAQAEVACRNAGKRLCALSEWLAACRGPQNLVYPYGNTYVRRRCNEARTPHPVVQFFGTSMGVFTFANMNNPGINMQPDSLARTGQFDECVSPLGLYDMVGNLHEWIADSAGTFKGGFYVDAEINGRGCLYTTTAHGFSYRDYSTGFRCCADPR